MKITLIPLLAFSSRRFTFISSFSPLFFTASSKKGLLLFSSSSQNIHLMTLTSSSEEEDPYLWLEEIESEASLNFAKEANEKCLQELGDPTTSSTGTYQSVLQILESNDRIAYPTKYGIDTNTGETILFNLWKDSKNPKGLWRKTTMESYRTSEPEWKTVLDIDALAEKDGISWVWKGNTVLPRRLDPFSDGKYPTRSLISLSRGGADATVVREFDMINERFLEEGEQPFNLPEAKSRASYKSRDVMYVGSDFGEGSLTDSGYPRVIKEWTRGTKLQDAPIVFEGEKRDVSVSAYVNDQRIRNGPIYDIRSRSMTFYTSKKWVRRVQFEHLLPADDPLRTQIAPPEDFMEVDVQDDADVSYVGKFMLISLRSDWTPMTGIQFKKGSLVYVDADAFLTKGKEACEYRLLFESTERTAYEGQSITKNYLILSTMDNVKSKMSFFKIEDDGFKLIGGDKEAKILDRSAGAVDPTESDDIWIYTSGYTEPSSLSFGDASRVETMSGEDESYLVEGLKSLPSQFDATDLEVKQNFAPSKDGALIPYFIISKRDLKYDGSNPTLLYGYGGFEVSLGPKYISTVGTSWLNRGGVYVEANIRGGGEFGPSWHQQGLKENRNKCFEDFIAVGEDLVRRNICTSQKLAARGGSNGGLLMGMMYILRPDLFGAIHCAVPLLDMKRYHKLLAGASWMAEYGNPDTDDWNFLQKYSPYHLLDPNNDQYPPILVTTSTRDDRVHPGHARKMVKKLWDISPNSKVYYYENIEGGHGGAADAKQSAFMTALAYDFMWNTVTK